MNLLSYGIYDQSNTLIHQGMGKTLNVSMSGIRIETHLPIDTSHRMVLAIGFGENLVEIQGQPVYCRQGDNDMYVSGISFVDVAENRRLTLSEFVAAFNAENPK
jgi:hypothetical protein